MVRSLATRVAEERGRRDDAVEDASGSGEEDAASSSSSAAAVYLAGCFACRRGLFDVPGVLSHPGEVASTSLMLTVILLCFVVRVCVVNCCSQVLTMSFGDE